MGFDYERWKAAQFNQSQSMDEDYRSGHDFPPGATWAGMIGTGFGVLSFLVMILSSLNAGDLKSPGCVLSGLLYLRAGLGTTKGTLSGIKVAGILSILCGFMVLLSGIMLLQISNHPGALFGFLGVSVCGGLLIVAGVLAIGANERYRRWRKVRAARVGS